MRWLDDEMDGLGSKRWREMFSDQIRSIWPFRAEFQLRFRSILLGPIGPEYSGIPRMTPRMNAGLTR